MTRTITALPLALALCVAAGCGGGGGGSSNNTPTPTVSISSANAETVAQAAAATTNADDGVIVGVDGLLGGGAVNATAASQRVAVRAAQRLRSHATAKAQVSDTFDCDLAPGAARAGTATISANVANPDQLTAGDTFSLSLTNCYDVEDGSSANGSLSGRVTSVGSDDSFGLTMDFNNLAVDGLGSEDFSIDGTLNALVSFPSTDTTRVVLSGGSFTEVDSDDRVTISNPSLTFTTDNTTGVYSVSGTSTITSADLGGTVSLDIPATTPLTGIDDGDPTSGSMKITGVNSNMTVTAVGGRNVRLDIDTSGDGVPEESRTVTWDEITI